MEAILAVDIQGISRNGIAIDYCVRATALHALERGYGVTVFEPLCCGVAPETSAGALKDLKARGSIIAADTREFL